MPIAFVLFESLMSAKIALISNFKIQIFKSPLPKSEFNKMRPRKGGAFVSFLRIFCATFYRLAPFRVIT